MTPDDDEGRWSYSRFVYDLVNGLPVSSKAPKSYSKAPAPILLRYKFAVGLRPSIPDTKDWTYASRVALPNHALASTVAEFPDLSFAMRLFHLSAI